MSPDEAEQRWRAFLAKIAERAAETLAQAEQGCAMLLDLNELDVQPMGNAWQGIVNQLRELDERIATTWDGKVAPALEAGGDDERLAAAEALGTDLRRCLERDREDAEVRIFASAARAVLERARKDLSGGFPCSQCRAPLQVSDRFFRSRHVDCPHCQRKNTFTPGAKVMSVEHFCCHHLAAEASLQLRRASDAAERSIRDDDLPSMRAAEAALEAQVRAYLEARMAIVPEYAADFAKDLRGRMAHFYERMSRTPGWIPRPAPT